VSFSSSRIGQFYFLTARWSTKIKSPVVKRVVDAISECITFLLFHLSHQTTFLRFRRHELLMLTTEMCALCTVIIRDGRKSFSRGNKLPCLWDRPTKYESVMQQLKISFFNCSRQICRRLCKVIKKDCLSWQYKKTIFLFGCLQHCNRTCFVDLFDRYLT
jgi:hypothetical protein